MVVWSEVCVDKVGVVLVELSAVCEAGSRPNLFSCTGVLPPRGVLFGEGLDICKNDSGVLFDRCSNADDAERYRLVEDLLLWDWPLVWCPGELSPRTCLLSLDLTKDSASVVSDDEAQAPSTEIESEGMITFEFALLFRPGR